MGFFYAQIFLLTLQTMTKRIEKNWLHKALAWATENHPYVALYQHNDIPYPHQGFENLLAIGNQKIDFSQLDPFQTLKNHASKWLFGYLGYDLKNHIEELHSSNPNALGFEDINFFEPQYLISFDKEQAQLIIGEEDLFSKISSFTTTKQRSHYQPYTADFSKAHYVKTVNKLIDHIVEGDCYEINLCQSFSGDFSTVAPVDDYLRLNQISPKPFSCFQKFDHQYIISASPERFIRKEVKSLISQPIKGTRPRGQHHAEDVRFIEELRTDKKEKAENLMIVDLVRNDLAKSSVSGSVKVEELFGIYSFEQVHQMISTVSSQLQEDITGIDAIRNAFPMGSMTGAPKIKVMELIDTYELTKRGAFSGAAGYIKPTGDFDFSVLIRSIFINEKIKKYGFHVGSAITYDAEADKEYDECLVKAKAILALINQ